MHSVDGGDVPNNDAGRMMQTPSPPVAGEQSSGRKAACRIILVCHGATESSVEVCSCLSLMHYFLSFLLPKILQTVCHIYCWSVRLGSISCLAMTSRMLIACYPFCNGVERFFLCMYFHIQMTYLHFSMVFCDANVKTLLWLMQKRFPSSKSEPLNMLGIVQVSGMHLFSNRKGFILTKNLSFPFGQ